MYRDTDRFRHMMHFKNNAYMTWKNNNTYLIKVSEEIGNNAFTNFLPMNCLLLPQLGYIFL